MDRAWNRTLNGLETRGSAADADADAILALILLVVRFENKGAAWWYDLAQWAYDSCKAFMEYDTQVDADGGQRVVRLGACRGGWSCTSPSYVTTAHYRVFDAFMRDYATLFNNAHYKLDGPTPQTVAAQAESIAYSTMWRQLIRTGYSLLKASQSPETGGRALRPVGIH